MTPLNIGCADWQDRLFSISEELGAGFWDGFSPVPVSEIEELELRLRRKLPDDYKLFLSTVGAGDFPRRFGGGLFTPAEVLKGCAGPILMLLGSSAWANDDENRAFYVDRGSFNPNPEKFVDGVTKFGGFDLLDFVQIGSNGMCCYYQLVSAEVPDCETRFCMITPEETVEFQHRSFSEGLHAILLDLIEWQAERE